MNRSDRRATGAPSDEEAPETSLNNFSQSSARPTTSAVRFAMIGTLDKDCILDTIRIYINRICEIDKTRRGSGLARRTREQVEDAIAAAVRAELTERGYQGVTFEGVAHRARTSKPVLYRRYSSRSEMVLFALGRSLRFEFPTGLPQQSLPDGILSMLRYARERFDSIGADTFRALIGEADQPTLALLSGGMDAAERALADQVITAAVARGELGRRPLAPGVLRVPYAILREQILFRTGPAMTLEEITDTICLPLLKAASTTVPHAPE